LDVPVTPGEALDRSSELVSGSYRIGNAEVYEIQTDTAHAGVSQGIELCVRRLVIDERNASDTTAESAERIDHAGVVSAVHKGVHDDNSIYVKGAMKGARLTDCRCFRCVRTSGPKSKTLRITEYVRMAIAGTTGNFKTDGCCGLRGIGKYRCQPSLV
jgi:hypothetical protein